MFFKKFTPLFFQVIILTSFLIPSFFGKSNEVYSSQENQINIDYLKNIPKDFFYILGSGDTLALTVSEKAVELNQVITIDDQGIAFIKRLGKSYVKGLTVRELSELLNSEYSKYVIEPSIKIKIIKHRPIKFYIDGEVENPGLHILPGTLQPQANLDDIDSFTNESEFFSEKFNPYYPSIVDALRKSGGITNTADLEKITVSRINNISDGGGRISTDINLLNMIKFSDISQNIRILDGDTILVRKNTSPALEQISKAIKTNINPKFINIFIGGRVEMPGTIKIDRSAVLVDAIAFAGGVKVIKGPVRFLRYNNNGTIDKRTFKYNPRASRGSYKNPYLRNGDVVFVGKSPLNVTAEVISEITTPIQGVVSSFGLYKALFE